MKVQNIKIEAIKPYERNTKKHPETQIRNIAESIKQFGFIQPLVLDNNNEIIIGHGRYFASQLLGMEEVPCVFVENLTKEQVRKLRILDNKLNESEWDEDLLKLEIEDLDFGDFDVDFGLDFEEEEKQIIEDEVPKVDDDSEPITQLGDIWQLGEHRLMCGDSTDKATVEMLMNGNKADMVFTDPPYNVDYSSKNAFLNEVDKGNRIQKNIAGDFGYTDEECGEKLWKPAFQNMRDNAKDHCSIYVTMPQGGAHMMMMMMCSASWQVKHELIWVKNNHVLGRTDYFYKHEPILYGWAKTHKWYGKGEFDKSIWEIPKPQKSDLHPTMKPIRLIANCLQNNTLENDLVLDLFGGSGSTLIACEQLNRTCYMMELDPKYCDVIIKRWEKLTGKKAVKIN